MEYILQRQGLRCPLNYLDYRPTWDFSDLDGGCDTWRRFQEKRLPDFMKMKECPRDVEQFNLVLENEAIATSMWQRRAEASADQDFRRLENGSDEGSSVGIDEDFDHDDDEHASVMNEGRVVSGPEADKIISTTKAKFATTADWQVWSQETDRMNGHEADDDDEEDDDDDDDDNGTIYSRALPGPPSSHQVLASDLHSSSTTNVEIYATTPCTLESLTIEYQSLNWGNNVEESDWQGMLSQTQPAPKTTNANDVTNKLAFRGFLANYVNQAWLQYEHERVMKMVDKYRTLSVKQAPMGRLSVCDWKWLPLYDSYEVHEAYSMGRPTTGRCAYERTPTIIVTNEDGEHFRLLEVTRILTEVEIAEIRRRRDLFQDGAKKDSEIYSLYNVSVLEGQKRLERGVVDAARAWWASEQEKHDSTYIDWKHAEAQEAKLLKRQIEREAEQHLKDAAMSEAKERQKRLRRSTRAARTHHFADLKLKLDKEGLVNLGGGRYAGADYCVNFDGRVLRSFLARRDDVDAMAFLIDREERSVDGELRELARRRSLHKAACGRSEQMLRVVERRREEILNRHAHRMNPAVFDWIETNSGVTGEEAT